MFITDDEDDRLESDENQWRLYIDEDVADSIDDPFHRSTKSTNTGNPFELDSFLIATMNRCQTKSSQTILTSDTSLLLKRDRSTFCQAEYFSTKTQQTNTDHHNDQSNDEECILVAKKQRTEHFNALISLSN